MFVSFFFQFRFFVQLVQGRRVFVLYCLLGNSFVFVSSYFLFRFFRATRLGSEGVHALLVVVDGYGGFCNGMGLDELVETSCFA